MVVVIRTKMKMEFIVLVVLMEIREAQNRMIVMELSVMMMTVMTKKKRMLESENMIYNNNVDNIQ